MRTPEFGRQLGFFEDKTRHTTVVILPRSALSNRDLQRPNEKPRTIRVVQPQLIRSAMEAYLNHGQESFEESKELERLLEAMRQSRDKYTIDQFKEDLERNIFNLRRRREGRMLGSEAQEMEDIRNIFTAIAEDIWTSPNGT